MIQLSILDIPTTYTIGSLRHLSHTCTYADLPERVQAVIEARLEGKYLECDYRQIKADRFAFLRVWHEGNPGALRHWHENCVGLYRHREDESLEVAMIEEIWGER